MTFRVVIEPVEDGVFVAEVPVLPGRVSQGRTRTEAIENIKEGIAAYLESLKRHSEPVRPSVSEEIVEVRFDAHTGRDGTRVQRRFSSRNRRS